MPRGPAPQPGLEERLRSFLQKMLVFVVIIGVPYGLLHLAMVEAEGKESNPPQSPLQGGGAAVTSTPVGLREPEPTWTPGPQFEATQQVYANQESALRVELANLEAEKADLQAEIERRKAEAADAKDRREAEQDEELHDLKYYGMAEEINAKIESLQEQAAYERELHQAVISNTLQMGQVEAKNRDARLKGVTWILVGALGAAGLVLVVAGGFLAFRVVRNVAWRIEDGYEAEVEETTEKRKARIEAEMVQVLNEERAQALGNKVSRLSAFVYDCIRVNGEEDHQVPANTRPGMEAWHANRWSEVVAELKHDGAVQTIRGGNAAGTYVQKPYINLGGLRDALAQGTYHHSPSSRAEAARLRWLERIGSVKNARE